MTFSIVGQCSRSGMFGIGITTSSICVASRCSWARAGIGAVATQNLTDPRLGLRGLDLMAAGLSAGQALERLVAESRYPEHRQLAAIDRMGQTAHYSGSKTLGSHTYARGEHCLAAGNLLANLKVPQSMVAAFEAAPPDQHLAERLLRALEEGWASGGEEFPIRSAGLLVVHEQPWPLVDLRVDWHEKPLVALRDVWRLYEPQMDRFVLWALSPGEVPFSPPEAP